MYITNVKADLDYMIFAVYKNENKVAEIYLKEEKVTEYGIIYSANIKAYSFDESLCIDYYHDKKIILDQALTSFDYTIKYLHDLAYITYFDTIEETKEIEDLQVDDGYYIMHKVNLVTRKDLILELNNTLKEKDIKIKSLKNENN